MLDVVDVAFKNAAPENFQTENHVIDEDFYWAKQRRASWQEAVAAVDAPTSLWIDGQSTYHGINDKIAIDEANKLKNSLLLIVPNKLRLSVTVEGFIQRERQVRASFELNGTNYKLKVTDPIIEQEYRRRDIGVYEIKEAILCVSLAEEFKGHTFKLVASVLTPT